MPGNPEVSKLNNKSIISNLTAAAIFGILNTSFVVSYAALIFSSTCPSYFVVAVSLFLLGGCLASIVICAMSSYSGVIAMIQDVPVAISGLIALSLATMLQGANPDVLFANIFAAIALATLLTGIAFLLLGYFRLGNLVRFIPFPVMGGFLAATPERMTVATKAGIPQVICPGAIGDVVFGPPEEIPEKFKGRAYAIHSSLFSCVRTTAEEVRALAVEQAKRVNPAKGPVEWFIPLKGFCSHSVEGAPIHDHESDMAYVDELKKQLRDDIPIHTRDTDINDPVFAAEIAKRLIELMKKKYG